MTKFNQQISGNISTLLSDLTHVHETTPSFEINQKQSDILSGNLTNAQQDLAKDDFNSAKAKIVKAFNAYHKLSKGGVCSSDDCDMDVDILKESLKKVKA